MVQDEFFEQTYFEVAFLQSDLKVSAEKCVKPQTKMEAVISKYSVSVSQHLHLCEVQNYNSVTVQ